MRVDLPEVVLTTSVSVDGRITLGREQPLLDPQVGARWSAMSVPGAFEDRHALIDAQVILEGSGSSVGPDAPTPAWPPPTTGEDLLWQDHLPSRALRWFVVADGRGRVDWTFTGDADLRLHVLVCRNTPPGYPGLVGGAGTPTMMDGPALLPDELPLRLSLIDVRVEGDAVRTRYRVAPVDRDA
ncbi:hypothetical protein [Terrabacter carboxydivorans]|uniref:Uncharacterized protein n=1 Tax=Terrabacter carboxydivorans TaxID=619730 RepID=A0ABN3M1Y2_9MICO